MNHPQSPLRPRSQASIPHLRLHLLKSPEYDRSELLKARAELEEWLSSYAGHEHETAVRIELGDCLRRLSSSDLVIAGFYTTVGNEFGARQHAARAVDEARLAGDEDLVREAEASLRRLPAPRTKDDSGAKADTGPDTRPDTGKEPRP